MDIKNIAASLHHYERNVLPLLQEYSLFSDIVKETGMQDVQVMRAIQWLTNKGLVTASTTEEEICVLEKNGEAYRTLGLPERRFLQAVAEGATWQDAVIKKAGIEKEELNISIGELKKKAAIEVSKDQEGMRFSLTPAGKKLLERPSLEEAFLKKTFPLATHSLTEEGVYALGELKKRKEIIKIVKEKTITVFLSSLGKEVLKVGLKDEDVIDRVTAETLSSRSWKHKTFRRYDVCINVPKIAGGKRHIVNQAARYIKKIWLEIGFEEMEGNLVQTSFWDLDALFVPQDHPARAMQDTFYIKDPKNGTLPKELAEKVKATHERGWNTGSRGWGGAWSAAKAKENLLRTHTTVLSAQTIAKLKAEDLPKKYFSVAKVFRNEALDWKHLFEFYQVEGIVVDPDANLKHLIGYLREFYRKMGFSDVRIRPAHFPYTEPSLEVDVYHPERKVWIELGGAGIFRPEVVVPLLGKDVPVLAWGQGLERGIMDYYKLTDLRDLYKNDIKQLQELPCWMK